MKIYSKITSKIHPPESFKSIPGGLEPRFDHFAKGFPFRNKHSEADVQNQILAPKSFKSIPGGLEPKSDHFAKDFSFRNKDSDTGLQNQILTLLEAETKTLDLHFENIEPKPILVLIVLSVPLDLLHEKIRLGSTL